jgi:hypothetical protein
MALKNTAPLDGSLRAKFNWVTQSGASVLKNLPFGGATGVVASGLVLWFKPEFVPEGWSAEAVLSLGMGGGIVAHRIFDGLLGWLVEPARLHLGASWEASLRLRKLERYRSRKLIPDADAEALMTRIVKDDVAPRPKPRR